MSNEGEQPTSVDSTLEENILSLIQDTIRKCGQAVGNYDIVRTADSSMAQAQAQALLSLYQKELEKELQRLAANFEHGMGIEMFLDRIKELTGEQS